MATASTLSGVPAAWTKSSMSMFGVPPIQGGILSREIARIHPNGNLQSTPYQFVLPAKGDQYIDITAIELYVKAKLVRNDNKSLHTGTETKDKAVNKAALVANSLHSLWSEVVVELNGVGVSDSSNLYAYRAFLETALSADYESSARSSTELYCPDTVGKGKDDEDPTSDSNKGLKLRYSYTGGGVSFQMRGRLHGDIFNSGRMLPDGVNVHIKLIPTSDRFRIISKSAKSSTGTPTDTDLALIQEKVVIEDIYIVVPYITPSDSAYQMNKLMFAQGQHAQYPLNRILMRARQIPTGSTRTMLQNVFTGQLPNRFFFGVIPTSNVQGAYDKNPFHFANWYQKDATTGKDAATNTADGQYVQDVAVIFNGERLPTVPYDSVRIPVETQNHSMLRPYYDLMEALEMWGKSGGIALTRDYWMRNLAIYGFHFNPDGSESDNFNVTRRGNLDIDIILDKATTTDLTVIMCGEFESIISIRPDRTVYTDFV